MLDHICNKIVQTFKYGDYIVLCVRSLCELYPNSSGQNC